MQPLSQMPPKGLLSLITRSTFPPFFRVVHYGMDHSVDLLTAMLYIYCSMKFISSNLCTITSNYELSYRWLRMNPIFVHKE